MSTYRFDQTTSRQVALINKHLKECFGIGIHKNSTSDELSNAKSYIVEKITKLKYDGKTPKDAEYSKLILMQSAVEKILEQRLLENAIEQQYNKIISWLANCVVHCALTGDTIDESVRTAMKEYASSPYRFDNERVERDVREAVAAKLSGDILVTDESWDIVSPEQKQAAEKFLKDKGSKLLDVGFVDHEPDSRETFIDHRYMRKDMDKSKVKENYVKQLRTLLENEVQEAEVVIAAKGFSGEIQEMIEKMGRLTNEDLGSVADQMRQVYGANESYRFYTEITAEFETIINTLRSAKKKIDDSVDYLSTGIAPANDMDAVTLPDEFNDVEVDTDVEMGQPEEEMPLGRELKDSVDMSKAKALEEQIKQAKSLLEKAKAIKSKK